MPHFFVRSDDIDGTAVRIRGADALHLRRSLRVRPGETIRVVDEDRGVEHGVRVDAVSDVEVQGRVIWSRDAPGEPSLRIHVLLALSTQHMDRAVEGIAVAGAASIRPVRSERSMARPDAASAARRGARWQTLAREAAQLAGRAQVPPVADVLPLSDAVRELPHGCPILACVITPDATPILASAPGDECTLVIGPEGGLGPRDQQLLRGHGAAFVHLGPRTYPHHAAGLVACSLLLGRHGDLDRAAPEPAHP